MNDPARAREILECYGADAARWPADECDAVLFALRSDAGLRAERDDAAGLDAMLGEWAGRDLGGRSDAGAAAARVLQPAPIWRRWAAGGGVAAALAAGMLLGQPEAVPVPRATVVTVPMTDATAFSTLFTTTPDEDDLI